MLALELDKDSGEQVSLLRRAMERQDRELVNGIITVRERRNSRNSAPGSPPFSINVHNPVPLSAMQATGHLLRRSTELPLTAREAVYEACLRLEDWAQALRQYPSLLENPAVRRALSLQVGGSRMEMGS